MPQHHTHPNPPHPPEQAIHASQMNLYASDRLLNVQQVAEITGLAVQTLNRARLTGADAPPFLKIGKACRYRMSSVQAWIASHQEFRHTSAQQAA